MGGLLGGLETWHDVAVDHGRTAGRAGGPRVGDGGQAAHLTLGADGDNGTPTSVTLFDQGLVQVLQASVTGLAPKQNYVLALADDAGALEPLAGFKTNPAGAAIVNTTGPIRQIVTGGTPARRTLVVAEGTADAVGAVVQRQRAD